MLNSSAKALDVFEVVVGQIPCSVELVSPGAVVAFDMAVEFGGGDEERSMPRSWHSRSKPEPPSTWMAGEVWCRSLSRKRLTLQAVALRQACAQVRLVTGSQAANCGGSLLSRVRERVSRISPDRVGLRPFERRVASCGARRPR